jgi:hypothetical protein
MVIMRGLPLLRRANGVLSRLRGINKSLKKLICSRDL